jgi:hypothetical protein
VGDGGLRRDVGLDPALLSIRVTVAGTHGRTAEQERDRGPEAGGRSRRPYSGPCRPHIRAGVRLGEIDRIVEEFIRFEGGEPTYKGYRSSPSVPPFPATICTAVNEEIVHGILQWQGHESQLLGCVPYGAIVGEGARAAY